MTLSFVAPVLTRRRPEGPFHLQIAPFVVLP
jgi:hypothetical protein